MISWLLAAAILLQAAPADTGDVLTLRECHRLVEQYYPAADKIDLQRKIVEINTRIAASGRYPGLSASAMASYQSDVTEVTFTPPGVEGPSFSRDHYRVGVDLSQTLYDGGTARARESLERSAGRREAESVRVTLQGLKEQVNRVYFNTLMLSRELESARILMEELRQQIRSVRAKVGRGVLLPSQQYILEAEMIRARQDSIRLAAERRGSREMLEILTGAELGTADRLRAPEVPGELPPAGGRQRAEFGLYEASGELLDDRIALQGARLSPRISAYGSAAYGRPGLDAFDDDLQAWYVVGLRMRWDLWNAVNARRQQQALRIEKKQVEADRNSFSRQLEAELSTLREQARALQEVLESDGRLVDLSRRVVEEHSSRLNEGVITATEYLSSLHRLNRALLEREVHRLRLARVTSDYLTKLGEPIR